MSSMKVNFMRTLKLTLYVFFDKKFIKITSFRKKK